MDTEQSVDADSDASIQERLSAVLTPEAAQDEPPPAAPEAEETPQVEEQAETEEVQAVETDVPGEPNDPKELRALMTRKTQHAANLAETAQDRLHFAEVKEHFSEAISQKSAEVHAAKLQLQQLKAVNPAIFGGDITQYWQHTQQIDTLQAQVNEGERQLSTARGQLGHIAEQHAVRQWQLAVDGAKQRIGTFTPGEDAAMLKQVADLGFTEKELRGRFADPRILHAIYKSMKWDTLQANKGKAVAAAQAAPPVLKPGASKGPGAATENKYRDARAQLKKSGDMKDAARLFLMRK